MSLKLLVLVLAVLFGLWLFQRGRRVKAPKQEAKAQGKALPMVRCAHCGVHVPGHEATTGARGSYCSAAHRRESEGA